MNSIEQFFHQTFSGEPVSLMQMLEARENRVYRQEDLLARFGKPLLCFTMNIAGPVKNNSLIHRAFTIGVIDFKRQLMRVNAKILFEAVLAEQTGNEAYLVVDMDPYEMKRLTCELEDADDLGRLYDMDILFPLEDGSVKKIDRQEIGLSGRPCLICGKPGKDCSSRRLHKASELQAKTFHILIHQLPKRTASEIAEYACRALLYEVSVSPKPGLVDRFNSGSHKDMDFYSFLNSSSSLWPYFENCARTGMKDMLKGLSPTETFAALRSLGKFAENRMLAATGGVNTHKGAIFSLGIICAAAGRILMDEYLSQPHVNGSYREDNLLSLPLSDRILNECSAMTSGLIEKDFSGIDSSNAVTVGQKLYADYGITGVRGQMEAGLPAVSAYGLPLLRSLLKKGYSIDETGRAVLLTLIAHTTDTNLIHRSDVVTQKRICQNLENLLNTSPDSCPSLAELEELDRDFISRNLSPGGSADLLAVCWLLYTLEEFYDQRTSLQ